MTIRLCAKVTWLHTQRGFQHDPAIAYLTFPFLFIAVYKSLREVRALDRKLRDLTKRLNLIEGTGRWSSGCGLLE